MMSIEVKQRKIILDLAVTLDGFIEGKNGEVDWCIMDADMGFIHFLNQIDTILYGRKSYDLWGQYTPGSEDPQTYSLVLMITFDEY
jgi:dihydrofolate reductase